MLVRVPDFFDSFKCSANNCLDTCCRGWEIDIDKKSLENYSKVSGEFGEKLQKNIKRNHFKLTKNKTCPFLQKDNLCEIYCKLGKRAICKICKEHPRFINVFGDIMERGLGLCCEEVVKLLFASQEPLTFKEYFSNDKIDKLDKDDEYARDVIFKERDKIFKILANKSISLKKRIGKILQMYKLPQPLKSSKYNLWFMNNTEAYNLLHDCESINKNWEHSLLCIKIKLDNENFKATKTDKLTVNYFTDEDGARLITYLLFRYFATSINENYFLGKVLFAIFFWDLVRIFTTEISEYKIDNVKIFAVTKLSKELEYSDKNMNFIETSLNKKVFDFMAQLS